MKSFTIDTMFAGVRDKFVSVEIALPDGRRADLRKMLSLPPATRAELISRVELLQALGKSDEPEAADGKIDLPAAVKPKATRATVKTVEKAAKDELEEDQRQADEMCAAMRSILDLVSTDPAVLDEFISTLVAQSDMSEIAIVSHLFSEYQESSELGEASPSQD